MTRHAYEKPLAECTVAIAGLGLMGGSLALALRGKAARIVGVARRRETLEEALRLEAIDEASTTLAAGVAEADVIVLATPVGVILHQLEEIGVLATAGCTRPGAVVTDMGSTKALICEAMAGLPAGLQPVPAHPMCGKETSGLEAAEADLFRDAPYVLCPLSRSAPKATALVETLAQAIGACPLRLDPARHDRLAAAVSHVPYLLATLLFGVACQTAGEDEMAWRLAAGGFRSTTRLAGSDPRMMTDILLSNRESVLANLSEFQAALDTVTRLLIERDEAALHQLAAKARQSRDDFLERFGP